MDDAEQDPNATSTVLELSKLRVWTRERGYSMGLCLKE